MAKMYAFIGFSVSPAVTPFRTLVAIPGSAAVTKMNAFVG